MIKQPKVLFNNIYAGMKPLLLSFFVVLLTIGASSSAKSDEATDALYKTIQTAIARKQYTDAVTKATQALDDKTLVIEDRSRFLNAAAEASMKQLPPAYQEAKGFYEQIVGNKLISNTDKINAYQGLTNAYIASLAGQYLDQMNLKPAQDYLDQGLQLPNLGLPDQAVALKNLGDLYRREDRFDDAIATYQKIIALKASDEITKSAWQSLADSKASQGKQDEAITIYKTQSLDVISLYKNLGQDDRAIAGITTILDDAGVDDKAKWAAFNKLPYWDDVSTDQPTIRRRNVAGIQQFSEKYLPGFIKVDPNRARVLWGMFRWYVPVFRNGSYDRFLGNPAFLAWAAPIILQTKLSDGDYAFVKTKYVNALAGLGDDKQVASETASLQVDARLSKQTQFWAQLVNIALTSTVDNTVKLAQSENALPEKDKAQAILDAVQTLSQADKNEAAQKLYDVYDGLFVHLPRAAIKSTFVDNAPQDAGGWAVSALLKNSASAAKLDRPYGDNLKLLLQTDSTATGRNASAADDKKKEDTETNLYTVNDARGVYLYFDAHDSRAQDVVRGLASGGSIEMYLAPGTDQPYYMFLPELPTGKMSIGEGDNNNFVTMYPNENWRSPSIAYDTMRTNALLTDKGFGLSLFLSWETLYDKLPHNGTKWQFEAIRWTRAGGFSFGGSQSVHNRSSWGDIIFDGLTPQRLNDIKREIVFTALAKFKAAKGVLGVAGKWNDPELGDPAFYKSQVVPLLTKLDLYAARVNDAMSDADINDIYDNAVPSWMEMEFKIGELRKDYLMRKVLEP